MDFLTDEGIQRDMELCFAPPSAGGNSQARDTAIQRLDSIGFTQSVHELLVNLPHINKTPPSRRMKGDNRNSNPCKRCKKDKKKVNISL